MQKKIAIAIFMVIQMNSIAQTNSIKFANSQSIEEAVKIAKKEKKYILLDFYATWCTLCKKMEKEVYTHHDVFTYINGNFITLKIQIDTSLKDNESIKSTYEMAAKLKKLYDIRILPTFIFLESNGTIIDKKEGYLNVQEMITQCKSIDDIKKNRQLTDKKISENELTEEELVKIAPKNLKIKDDSLSIKIAQQYKERITTKRILSQEFDPNFFTLINNFPILFKVNDTLTKYIYHHKIEIDSILKQPGVSNQIIEYITNSDIIFPLIKLSGEYTSKEPDWLTLKNKIEEYWDHNTASNIILNNKINWYKSNKYWHKYILYQTEKIDKNGIQPDIFESSQINNFVFDFILKKSNDKLILKKACSYMKEVVNNNPGIVEFLDTYANVLYKYGDRSKAIETEKQALKISMLQKRDSHIKLYKETLSKMEFNQAIWGN
ncbi:thioredoxin family protein [Chitinophaga qingshengii]|uniref:Thioredoxin family protein n=1 Tax=Chitinophaga qingshengii TaxID=1569794 RepID=A0ABR7TWT3_9BACT|nr:thioredoxin family protein [Chitinophaga qingshengii]MBC9934078.1 thioredoxin family protein [Chitinophaga qingshengii]